ncbi:MAG: PorV/PorQ family protein [Candidatus Firestonebacteria bacterium]
MKIFVLIAGMLFISCSVYAGGPGTTASNFLRIGTGARASGMGEAQVAISDNVDSVYWNPAGLALVKNTEISLMHLIYWQGISYEYAAIALPIKKIGTFGIGIDYLNSGNIDKTTENATGSDYTAAGSFSYEAFAGTISYGNKFVIEKMPINMGASIKVVGDKIEDDLVLGAGLDIGLTSELIKNGYLGAAIQNIGVTFAKNTLLPMQLKVGGGYLLEVLGKDHLIVGAVDGIFPFDSSIKLNAGMEYSYQKTFFIRVGYKVNYALENLTAGAGFRLNIDRMQYELNYSYTPGLEDVGTSHRISLLVRLGLPMPGDIPEETEDNYTK